MKPTSDKLLLQEQEAMVVFVLAICLIFLGAYLLLWAIGLGGKYSLMGALGTTLLVTGIGAIATIGRTIWP